MNGKKKSSAYCARRGAFRRLLVSGSRSQKLRIGPTKIDARLVIAQLVITSKLFLILLLQAALELLS